jgi:hypothetical protein
MSKREGLTKYDAPLKIQNNKGYNAFWRGKDRSPYHYNTMQYREWQRGYNKAYFENLSKCNA